MLLKELRDWGGKELTAAGIESARLDADILLGEALGFSKIEVLTKSSFDLALLSECEGAIQRYRTWILRRAAFEPVAYIIGRKDFYEHELLVSPAVLIPRPETEQLVEKALECLGEQLPASDVLLVDVGTGSGAIVLSVVSAALARWPSLAPSRLAAVGIDFSPAALEVAKRNRSRLNLEQMVQLVRGDLLDGLRESGRAGRFTLICANLPYIPDDEPLPASVEQYEPKLALRAGVRGMDLMNRLLDQVFSEKPFEKGRLLMELGRGQDLEVNSRLFALGQPAALFYPDLQGIHRIADVTF
ncbi:MAG: peptide chain release factor N(5)-glutamine methyltransferase [Bdellovibrionota bacterium]